MNAITVWNPFKEMDELHNRLSNAFLGSGAARANGHGAAWTPAVDVIEDEKDYHIVVELPGLTKKDIEVKVDGDWLHITGERKAPETKEGRNQLRRERAYGPFTRSFRLPDDANPAGVSAEFREGLLQVSLSKREEALPKVIDVKIG